MDLNTFIGRIVDDGIEAARRDYASDKKKRGAVAGLEACRGKKPGELKDLLEASAAYFNSDKADYWWCRCYQLEVEWVCNCVSAVLHNQGLPVIVTPTARGVMKAAEVVGVGC